MITKLAVKLAKFKTKANRRICDLELELVAIKSELEKCNQKIRSLSAENAEQDTKLDRVAKILIENNLCSVKD